MVWTLFHYEYVVCVHECVPVSYTHLTLPTKVNV